MGSILNSRPNQRPPGPPDFMTPDRRSFTATRASLFATALALMAVGLGTGWLGGCSGRSLRSGVSVGPRLTSARLGSVRSAMTYDGDWLGGTSPPECLIEDLQLAARRGVEVVVDLRAPGYQKTFPLDEPARAAGLDLVQVAVADSDGADDGDTGFPPELISDGTVDRVREILLAPGRRRTLLLDGDGTLSSMIYAVHLSVDEGVAEAEALRAARETGLSRPQEEFVKRQIDRLRSQADARR